MKQQMHVRFFGRPLPSRLFSIVYRSNKSEIFEIPIMLDSFGLGRRCVCPAGNGNCGSQYHILAKKEGLTVVIKVPSSENQMRTALANVNGAWQATFPHKKDCLTVLVINESDYELAPN